MSRRPVDLSIGNSIIAAFAQGRSEALERMKNKQAQEQKAIENEQEKLRREQQQKQFEAAQKQAETFHKASMDVQDKEFAVQKALATLQIDELLKKQIGEGGVPSGYSKVQQPELDEEVRNLTTFIGEPPLANENLTFKRGFEDPTGLFPAEVTRRNPAAILREKTLLEKTEKDQALARQKELSQFTSELPGVISNEKLAEFAQQFQMEDIRNKHDIEMERLAAQLGKYNRATGSSATSARAEEYEAIADLYNANPELFYSSQGTPAQKLAGAAMLKKKYGKDILADASKVAAQTAKTALEQVNKIEAAVKDGTFDVGATAKLLSKAGADASLLSRRDFSNSRELNKLVNNLLAKELQLFTNLKPFSEEDRKVVRDAASVLDMGQNKEDFLKELANLKRILPELQKPILSSNPAAFDRSK